MGRKTNKEKIKENIKSHLIEFQQGIDHLNPDRMDLFQLGEILNGLEALQKVFDEFKLETFSFASQTFSQILEKIISDQIDYSFNVPHLRNFQKKIESFLNAYFDGTFETEQLKKETEQFDKICNTEPDNVIDAVIESTSDETAVIQKLGDDALEDETLIDFIGECDEMLESMDSILLELEKEPENAENINKFFRMAHTIKGTAGFLGLVTMGTLTHHLEDIFVQIRDGNESFTPKIFDACFKALDILTQLVQQVKDLIEGNPPTPINVQMAFEALLQSHQRDTEEPQEETSSLPNKPLGEILVEMGEVTLEQIDDAVELQQKPLGEILVEQHVISQETVTEALQKQQKQAVPSKLVEMVKVPADKLDELAELVGEMVVALSVLSQNPVISSIVDREAHERLDQLEKVTEYLRDRILGIRMFPVGTVFSKLSRQVRDLSRKSGKQINLNITGADTLVDKTVIDGIYAPLMHLIRNAIDHGIEKPEDREAAKKPLEGNVSLLAHHAGDSVILEVQDDGAGLKRDRILRKAIERGFAKKGEHLNDQQIFSFIFQAGFSTAQKVTDVSGRGVGMDVVKREIENLRGKITIDSAPGVGTTFTIKLPLTTSIIEGLIVRIGHNRFVVPILEVNVTVTPKKEELQGVQGEEDEFFIMAGQLIPIVRLYQFYQIEPEVTDPSKSIIIVVQVADKKFGLMVDELLHRQQIVIKDLGEQFSTLAGITGGTILGDGRVGLILEPEDLIQNYQQS